MVDINSHDISEEIDIEKYWSVLKRRWLPGFIVFAAIAAITSVLLVLQKPSYEAQAKVLIKNSKASNLTGLGEGIGELEGLNQQTTSPLETQAEIVRSVPVAQEAIKELRLVDEQNNPLDPDTLLKDLIVKGLPGTDVMRISYKAEDADLSAAVVNKVVEVYIRSNVQANRGEAISARKFISEQLPETEEAVRLADLALRQFKEKNNIIILEDEAKASVQVISALDAQILQSEAELSDLTARVGQLKTSVGVKADDAVVLARLSQATGVQEVLAQLQETQRQLVIEQTRYEPGYPTIVNLERKVAALNSLLRDRIQQIIGSNQQILPGSLQVGSLQEGLIQDYVETETARLGLINKISSLEDSRSSYVERGRILPKLEQNQQELERKLQAAQSTYEALLTRLQETQIAENQNIGNVRVISPALIPKEPVSSKKKLILGAGIFSGLLLALATAFALDLIDRSVKTVQEAKELLGYTLLGIIPMVRDPARAGSYPEIAENSRSEVIVRDIPHSPISESYRMLQANLKFLGLDNRLKTIVVTSSVDQEGKSEVSANLGAAMAQVGRKVLLVDADMRHPTQQHRWNLTNAVGLSNLIVEQGDTRPAIQEVMPNLYVLTAGATPPNPIALLDSKKMAALIQEFSQSYDFVIFDSPPLSGTADAGVLGKMADGIVLVVRPGVVDSASVLSVKQFLSQSKQNVLGMVINAVDIKNEPDSYFYYTQDLVKDDSTSQLQIS